MKRPLIIPGLALARIALALAQPNATAAVTTATGFAVEAIYSVPRESQGSWIALAADGAGGLLASDQYGPLYQITLPAGPGRPATARVLPLAIGGVHGLTWVGRDLYAVAGQRSVHPAGVYRLRPGSSGNGLEQVELLQALEGDGEHGPHAVMPAPDGRSLFVLAGNATRLPALTRSRVPPLGREEALFPPLPAVVGSENNGRLGGGWICRTDLDGRRWELVAGGLRNAYALAVDPQGEIFTFDSDTEFEINLPWYRPTRVLHVVSGADFGWRRGLYKVPDTAPDGWPAVLPLGLGSPTAVLFPRAARMPDRLRRALWVADWTYGRIIALHLASDGATFSAQPEEIVKGVPLPVTAICVNPADGALYFATGGRRTQSALYRLTWTGGGASTAPADGNAAAVSPVVAARAALEEFHGRRDSAAVDRVWPALAHSDPPVRRAARTALESQPVAEWAGRALAESSPRPGLAALLALARVDAPAHAAALLAALERHLGAGLDPLLQGEALRVLTLVLLRGGDLAPASRERWAARLSPLFPSPTPTGNAALLELLVFLRAPDAVARGFRALDTAVTREAQLDLARILRNRISEWSPEQRARYLAWLHRTGSWRGGAAFGVFLKELRREAIASASPADQPLLEKSLADSVSTAPVAARTVNRDGGRIWTVPELTALVEKSPRPRDPEHGRQVFAMAGCFTCHTCQGEGGALGPDLTAAGARMGLRDLLEAIIDPSREISDQYGTSLVRLRDGRRLSGRIINYTEQGPALAENLLDPATAVRLKDADIVSIEPAKVSLMPPGLLNALTSDEVGDLLAFLAAGRRQP